MSQQQNTTVIVQAPQAGEGPKHGNAWSTGMCGCFDDIMVCLCGWCCPQVLACQVATAMNEMCCVPNCLQGGLMAMRVKLRMMYNINGTICDDWCSTTYCGVCALCQMARELKRHGAM